MYLNFFTALWMVPLTQSKDDCCRRSKWKGNRPFDFLFDQTCSTTGDNGFISPLSALWSSVPLNMSLCTHMLIQFSFEYAHAVSLNWLSVSQRLENFTLPLHSHTHTLLQNCRDLVLVEQLIYLKAPISYAETHPPLQKPPQLPVFYIWPLEQRCVLVTFRAPLCCVTSRMISETEELKCCSCVYVFVLSHKLQARLASACIMLQ